MALAIFDLDNTLLAGDSDHAWNEFLIAEGLVDAERFREANDRFYRDYEAGCLDIRAYLRFALAPLAHYPADELRAWRARFMDQVAAPMMLPRAQALVDAHRDAGDTPLVITATNRFVVAPIVEAFGIDELIATEPEWAEGRYTGEVVGTPSYREGKITRLESWLAERSATLTGSYFYSDSHNDRPLLETVSYPHAVDPDPQLAALAEARGWPIISLRG